MAITLKEIQTDPDTGQNVAVCDFSNKAVRFLKDLLGLYIDGRFTGVIGDPDDLTLDALKTELNSDLHNIWRELNPS